MSIGTQYNLTDPYNVVPDAVSDPVRSMAAVTPGDGTVLAKVTRGLWVGVGGNVAVLCADDTVAVTLANVPSGTLLPLRVTKVMATNTTATTIVAMF